uniref:MarR family winged helix-turn-helix transcriptional regulator n=1 Tax=uncultured Sphingomonas sp. TaxID=158754 RepID=UPI0035CC7BB0
MVLCQPQAYLTHQYSLQSNYCLIDKTHAPTSDSPTLMPQDPISDLVAALQPVRRAWVQAANKTLAEVGLPTALGAIIVVTARMGEQVQQKALAAEVGVNPAALVRTLDQGEAAGLLVREGVEGDRRSKSVSLSPQGRILASQMEDMLGKLRQQLLCDVPVADILTATRILRMLGDRATGHAVAHQDDAGHAAR